MKIRFGIRTFLIAIALTAIVFSHLYRDYVERNTLLFHITSQQVTKNHLRLTIKSERLQHVILAITDYLPGEPDVKNEAPLKIATNRTYEFIFDPDRIRIQHYPKLTRSTFSAPIYEKLLPAGSSFNGFELPLHNSKYYGSPKHTWLWSFGFDYNLSTEGVDAFKEPVKTRINIICEDD